MTGQSVRPIDATKFFTYQNPSKYYPNWKEFYDTGLELRGSVIADYRSCLNVKYGVHPYNIMNIFVPENADSAPAILYFHGGRWREGHPAFYDYFARPWVDAGAVFVSCGYRLEPEVEIADSVQDAVAVVNWWGEHAGEYGGDPQRLTIAGHSAGGHLAAMVALTDTAEQLSSKVGLDTAIVMSAPTDLTNTIDDPAKAELVSPARLVSRSPRRVVVSFGNSEPNRKDDDDFTLTNEGMLLVRELTKAQIPHVTVALGKMDHISTAATFADPGSALFNASYDAIMG